MHMIKYDTKRVNTAKNYKEYICQLYTYSNVGMAFVGCTPLSGASFLYSVFIEFWFTHDGIIFSLIRQSYRFAFLQTNQQRKSIVDKYMYTYEVSMHIHDSITYRQSFFVLCRHGQHNWYRLVSDTTVKQCSKMLTLEKLPFTHETSQR